ncbi:hypothetical protein D046_7387C, partial [Vibrio parahaemolyticus V-223/04]
ICRSFLNNRNKVNICVFLCKFEQFVFRIQLAIITSTPI